jgi:hypothetical protein
MDAQLLFNVIVGVAGAMGGWILNTIWGEIKCMQESDSMLADKVSKIEILVAGQYCKRDEMERLSAAIFAKLDRIEDKLDAKADK